MIESDNGFSTYSGDYEEVMLDLTHLIGSLKLHNFTIPDIMYAVGCGLTAEWVEPNTEAKNVLKDIVKRKKNGKTQANTSN